MELVTLWFTHCAAISSEQATHTPGIHGTGAAVVTRLNEGLVPRDLLMELPDDLLLLCSLKLLDENILAAQHLSWACSSLQRRPTQNSGLGCEANNHLSLDMSRWSLNGHQSQTFAFWVAAGSPLDAGGCGTPRAPRARVLGRHTQALQQPRWYPGIHSTPEYCSLRVKEVEAVGRRLSSHSSATESEEVRV